MNILVPLYAWEGDTTEIDQAVDALRKGDIAVITGPQSGPPDESEADHLLNLTNRLHRNHVTVVGYIHVTRGERPIATVLDEMLRWRQYVGVDGVFVDEANAQSPLAYMRNIHGMARKWTHAKTDSGVGISVWNPGTWDVRIEELQRRLPTSIWCTWEGPAADYLTQQPRTHMYPKQECHLVYEAGGARISTPPRLGFAYVTNDTRPNQWDTFDETRYPKR